MEETFHMWNIFKEDDKLFATNYIDTYNEINVPLTKKVLQKAIEGRVENIRELEILLNAKVSDFDTFMKAAYIGSIMHYVEFIPSQKIRTKFPEFPDSDDKDTEETKEKKRREWDFKCQELAFNYAEKLKKELSCQPISSVEFWEKVGIEKITELWDDASYRWGWSIDDFFDITSMYYLDAKDMISCSEKFKRAVVSLLAVNMYDELVMAFAQGDNQGDYTITLEEVLALPEE